MRVLSLVLLALYCVTLFGCATSYHASRTDTDGHTVVLDVKSYREFPGGVDIKYNRETGAFELHAGEVRDDSAEAMRDVILGVLPLIKASDLD